MPVTFSATWAAPASQARPDDLAIRGRLVLDQLDPVSGAVHVGDLDLDAIQRGHAPDQPPVARRPGKLEAEEVAKNGIT